MKKKFLGTLVTVLALSTALLLGGCEGDSTTRTSTANPEDITEQTTDVETEDDTNTAQPDAKAAITEDQAKEIALKDAQLKEDEVVFKKVNLKQDDGITEYEIEFTKDTQEYDYEINAQTGDIISKDLDTADGTSSKQNTNTAGPDAIGEDKALEIALKDAGVSEKDIANQHVELDNDGGKQVYEVEFHVGQTEYSYEIDVNTGEIISSESEVDD